MSEAKSVQEAILAVMQEVSSVQKDGKISSGGGYKFASETAFIEALRPAMVKHYLFIYPSGIAALNDDTYTTSGGSTMNSRIGRFRFSMCHAPSDTSIDIEVLGEGADIGDKASNKAMTAALKYALRQTFLISTGDDPDNTPSETQQRAAKKEQTIEDLCVGHRYAENVFAAKKMLEKFEQRGQATTGEILGWAKAYRAARDGGMKPDEAAATATLQYLDYKGELDVP